MQNSIGSDDAVHYLAQNPGGRTEAGRPGTDEALDHLHNLRSKVMEPLFWDFRSSVQLHLSPWHKPLLEGCHSFAELNNLMASLRTSSALYDAVLKASEAFCKEYELGLNFWVQCAGVENLNVSRNRSVHCSVADSADFLSKACDQPDAFPELDEAWTMVEALSNYSNKHAAALDEAAEAQRQEVAKATAAFKQRRQQKNQRK